MTGAQLTQLLIAFGPIALEWAAELAKVWNTAMTPEEVEAFCKGKRKSYDDYITAEKARRSTLTIENT